MARPKAGDFVQGRMKGGSVGLGHFEIVRCWAFKKEFFSGMDTEDTNFHKIRDKTLRIEKRRFSNSHSCDSKAVSSHI